MDIKCRLPLYTADLTMYISVEDPDVVDGDSGPDPVVTDTWGEPLWEPAGLATSDGS
jgi:hypothetical protein